MARTLIASDNFNRAGPGLGSDWNNLAAASRGNVVIDSSIQITGQYSGLGDDHPTARWVGAGTFSDDQYSSIVLLDVTPTGTTYRTGVIVRASADINATRDYYEAFINLNGTLQTNLVKFVNGTMTTLHSATGVTWALNDRLELEVQGTTLRVCKNGIPLGGSFTVTDTSLTTGKPGVSVTNSMTADSWEAGDVTTVTGPTIDTQPSDQAANEGATATLSVAATTSGGTMHFAWERQPPGGGSFASVGTDSSSYTTGALDCATDHGAQFRVTVTDDNGPTVSNAVGLTVRSVTTTSRPASDVTTTDWTASSGADFFALIDEAVASDADYITSPALSASTPPGTFGLSYPLNTGAWTTNFRAKTSIGTATMRVYLLNDAGTVVGTSADQTITDAWTSYSLSIVISGPATRGRVEIVI